MLIKKLSAAICSVLIAVAFSVGAFAETTAPVYPKPDLAYGSLANATESTSVPSVDTDPNSYYVDVFGSDPISNEERCYIKCMTFTAYYEGEAHNITIWVDKTDADNAKLFFDENGTTLTQSKCKYMTKDREQLNRDDENKGFEIVFKDDSLNVNTISFFTNLDRIENITPINVSNSPSQNVMATVPSDIPETEVTEEVVRDDIFGEIEETEESPQDDENKDEKKDGSKAGLIVAIVIIVAVIAAGAVVAVFIFKKKASAEKTGDFEQPENDIPVGRPNQQNIPRNTNQFYVPEPPTQAPARNTIDFSRIPTAASAPINQTYTGDASVNGNQAPKAPRQKKQNPLQPFHIQIMAMLRGEEPAFELPSNCVPVSITNSYELNVSDSEMPKFAPVANAQSADYIVLAGKYLYLNPIKYNGSGLKAYSSIKGLNRCFDVIQRGMVVQPLAQNIEKLAPAGVEQNPNSMILVQKGKINVE